MKRWFILQLAMSLGLPTYFHNHLSQRSGVIILILLKKYKWKWWNVTKYILLHSTLQALWDFKLRLL